LIAVRDDTGKIIGMAPFEGVPEEWQDDQETYLRECDAIIHVHQASETRDCDGLYHSSQDIWPSPEELNQEFADIRFHDKVVSWLVNSYSLECDGELHVYKADPFETRLRWTEPTEEGYRNTEARICLNPYCEPEKATFRDHTAEAAGY
jgi:hypothetical protein